MKNSCASVMSSYGYCRELAAGELPHGDLNDIYSNRLRVCFFACLSVGAGRSIWDLWKDTPFSAWNVSCISATSINTVDKRSITEIGQQFSISECASNQVNILITTWAYLQIDSL